MKIVSKKMLSLVAFILLFTNKAFAQTSRIENVNKATQKIGEDLEKVIDPLSSLLIIVGGVGAIGAAYSVYSKWQNGDEDAMKRLGRWMGAGIFILTVGILVKALFLGK